MKISFKTYPIDIILCILWGILLLPIALLSMNSILRILFGLPFLLFIPGYVLLSALFPTKKNTKGIDGMERIALSFALSLSIVPILGLILNYTPWGIRLETILLSLFFFIIIVSVIALYRWKTTDPEKRFILTFELSLPEKKNRLDTALIIILGISILIAFATIIYVITTPKNGEPFTEFYLLGPTGKATGYPSNLTIGENASVIIGLANHEYKTINYSIEIWLINQTTDYNESTHTNETNYTHMWFMDKITLDLNHTTANEKEWKMQWEYNYTFQIKRKGNYKLTFLLFTTPTEEYIHYEDYKSIAKQKIATAYERTYLKLNII
ncbi:MAG: DUF1616 domain-containing protein [Actinobacteria bacterium]|nr:DUF1616 domain-containing protein [Actinomycetota bacterium]MBE3120753.1 DUF1616 domain-containing protein [Thermoplasmata archaeon]